MQISTKFTIAVHILTAVHYFSKEPKITSDFLAASIGSNPVIIRNIMSQLREAGIIEVKRGPGGIRIAHPLSEISFLDLYRAVEHGKEDSLFHFHEKTNPQCPVGRNIHGSLQGILQEIQNDFERDLASHHLDEVYDNLIEQLKRE